MSRMRKLLLLLIGILLIGIVTVSALTLSDLNLDEKDFTIVITKISNEEICVAEKLSITDSISKECIEAEKDELKKEVDVEDHLDITQNSGGVIRVRK